jgi:hypothetical protein
VASGAEGQVRGRIEGLNGLGLWSQIS